MRFEEIFFREFSSFLNISSGERLDYKNSHIAGFSGFNFRISNDFEMLFENSFILEILKLVQSKDTKKIGKKEIVCFKFLLNDILEKVCLNPKFSEFDRISRVGVFQSFNTLDYEIFKIIFKNKEFFCAFSSTEKKYHHQKSEIDLGVIKNVKVPLKFRVAKTKMTLEEILKLNNGDLLSLDTDGMVDIILENKVIAKGEFVKVDNKIGVKIVNLEDNGDNED